MDDETGRNVRQKPTGVVKVTTNMNCSIFLDGKETGLTENTTFTFENVPFGRHLLKGATHRHIGSKEIFLSIPSLNVRLTLDERGGTLFVESELTQCHVGLEGKSYECPSTIENLKRGVYPITVSGDGFQFTDKIRIQNNQTLAYRITKKLVEEKETEAAIRDYQHALEMPEKTLGERKRKVSALDEILVNETRFDLKDGLEAHRRLVQAIRQEEFAKETMSKAIQIEKVKKKRKYGWILAISAAVLILAIGTAVIFTRASRNRRDEQAYRRALQSVSLADYQDYLKLFGTKATHYLEADSFIKKAERDRQEFHRAMDTGTIAACRSYLKEFGESARYRKEVATKLRELEIKQNFPDTLKKLHLIAVPGRSYFMGASPAEAATHGDNQPPMWLRINTFAIGRHEVTFDEYDAFCKETGHPLPDDARFGRGKHPVINVSWNDARAYCGWLSGKTGLTVRLPSEAEWEFACRASRTSVFFWGNAMDHQYCVSGKKKRGRTRPVESTKPNDLGLYDMSGNVYEWCADRYQDPLSPGKGERYRGSSYRFPQKYEKNKSKNPVFNAWGDRRVIRSGSYKSSDFSCRSSHRAGALPETKRNDIGFRIAVTIPR